MNQAAPSSGGLNVLEARVVLRDRTLLDVVDLALRFVVRSWRPYAILSAIVLVPAFLVTYALALWGGWGWGWTLAIASSSFAAAPFTALASSLLFHRSVRIRDVVRTTLSALPRLLGATFLKGCGIALLSLIFVLPAMWVVAIFFYLNEVIVLERATVGAAMVRMQRLLSGHSGDVLLAFLFLTALHVVAVFLGDTVGRSLLEDILEVAAPPSIFQAQGSAIALASFWAFVPFEATCRFLVYINARTRTEGWDVQTRFAAIAARAENEEGDALRSGRAA